MLREFEHRVGFIDRLNGCIRDERSPLLIRHTYKEMLTRRVFQITFGYEDADDCDLLRDDSVLKLCAGNYPSPSNDSPSEQGRHKDPTRYPPVSQRFTFIYRF